MPFLPPNQQCQSTEGTSKVKPIWILLKQETVSGSGISWAICMSAPRSRQITTPVPHHSVFYRPDALPAAQPTVIDLLIELGLRFYIPLNIKIIISETLTHGLAMEKQLNVTQQMHALTNQKKYTTSTTQKN